MPDDDQAVVLAEFIADLNAIWIKAGPPRSYTEVEALSRKFATPVQARTLKVVELKRSTTQRILAGRGRQLPSWQWVASLVTVLRVIAIQNGVPADDLGTLTDWKARYEQDCLVFRRRRAGSPSGIASPAEDHGDDRVEDAMRDAVEQEAQQAEARPSPALVASDGHHTPHRTSGAPGRTGRPSHHNASEDDGHTELRALARRFNTAGWWHPYRDIVPGWVEIFLELEQAAQRIRTYETHFIPGLLQTPGYAEAVIRLEHATASQAQINRRVELRMLRQRRLLGPNPPRLWAILDETVLHRQFGDQATMHAQLEHLLEISSRPNIRIQVMPLNKGGYAAAGGPITDLRFAEERLPDVIYLEHLMGAEYPSSPADIVHFGQVLDRLGVEAETPAATRDKLHRMCTHP
ncbi:DUF5753 domain-containing protein [Actinomadura sp. SCN-SB]|uniref:DUF5753 domain-containing protein n=1 Tax=Actinomadura sp. SCN-SB TaxID=3373092 RepID=UPI0037518CF5